MAGRILIADDVATNRIILKVRLSAASYNVSHASTQTDLLELAQSQQPDLIVLNSSFQNDRGIDLCHDLKQNPKTKTIPILIIASDLNPAERLAALHAGACDFLENPIIDKGLLPRIRNSLRVRSIQKELRLRRGTATELGFQEPAAAFSHPAQVVVVRGAISPDDGWITTFENTTPCTLYHFSPAQVLDQVIQQKINPDIIVIAPHAEHQSDGLCLLSELRSRSETRRAAIIIVDKTDESHQGVSAFDLGANDVVPSDIPKAEFIFRLTRQLERKKKADQLRNTLNDGLRMAMVDPLTGLFNRRYALPYLSRVAEKSKISGNPFTVMVLDLDHFKRINDTYGHATGDHVLCEVARRLQANLRNIDLIARIGGEEFLVVMPDTGIKSARRTAERLRRITQKSPIKIPGDAGEISITTSIGVSVGGLNGKFPADVETMVERADQALLGAKSTGRNQVTMGQSAA